MQSKGAIRFVAILLLLASLWQLSFTAVTQYQEKKAEKYADNKAEAAMQTAAYAKVAEADKAFYLDSLKRTRTEGTSILSHQRRFISVTHSRM